MQHNDGGLNSVFVSIFQGVWVCYFWGSNRCRCGVESMPTRPWPQEGLYGKFCDYFFARAIEMDSFKTNFHAPSANVWRVRILIRSRYLKLEINSFNELNFQRLLAKPLFSICRILAEKGVHFRFKRCSCLGKLNSHDEAIVMLRCTLSFNFSELNHIYANTLYICLTLMQIDPKVAVPKRPQPKVRLVTVKCVKFSVEGCLNIVWCI